MPVEGGNDTLERPLFLEEGTPGLLTRARTLQKVIAPLVFSALHMDYTAVGMSGRWTQAYVEDYAERRAQSKGASSVGYSYDDETYQAMQAAGFYTGPAVSVHSLHGSAGIVGEFQEDTNHAYDTARRYFSDVGIRTFFGNGRGFPGDNAAAVLVFDVSDPKFLTKIIPLFVEDFPDEALTQLKRPNHLDTDSQHIVYFRAVFSYLRAYGEEHGVSLPANEKIDALPQVAPDNWALRMAETWEHQKEALDVMMPILDAEQRRYVIGTILTELENGDIMRRILRHHERRGIGNNLTNK